MSETLRIALIAEGPTDKVIIEAALKKILHPKKFVMTLLQPEQTLHPRFEGGWGGVLKWCRAFHVRGYSSFEEDPTMELFDYFIVHLDADVAHDSYSAVSPAIEAEAQTAGWGALPCNQPCPPSEATVTSLRTVLLSWLGFASVGNRTILCMPSKSTETWLAVAVYPGNANLLNGHECALNMEGRLAILPKAERIKKTVREYQDRAATVTREWNNVRSMCSQAYLFHQSSTAIMIGGAA